jgi:hypothetical protein
LDKTTQPLAFTDNSAFAERNSLAAGPEFAEISFFVSPIGELVRHATRMPAAVRNRLHVRQLETS